MNKIVYSKIFISMLCNFFMLCTSMEESTFIDTHNLPYCHITKEHPSTRKYLGIRR